MKTTQKQPKNSSNAQTKPPKVVSRRTSKVAAKSVSKPVSKRVAHHAKKLLVPHKANDYRPHLIRLHGIIAVLVIALLAQVVYGFATTGHLSVLGRAADISTAELLADTNAERQAQGAAALRLNDKLTQAAFLKAEDMFANDYWAHVSPGGVEPWKWFADAGYNYSVAGENLAKNYPTAPATVNAWMNSETHRANILNSSYSEIGFAVVDGTLQGQPTTLVVALYGAPATATAVENQVIQPTAFSASTVSETPPGPIGYFGSALLSLSPVTIMILGLLAVVAIVGVAAHHYRNKLPKAWKKSWRLHHGMYTFVGMITLGVLIIVASGAGQI